MTPGSVQVYLIFSLYSNGELHGRDVFFQLVAIHQFPLSMSQHDVL